MQDKKDDYLIIITTLFLAALIMIMFVVTGCSTKRTNESDFKCNCDCKENSFECELKTDKVIKILHKEGDENGQDN